MVPMYQENRVMVQQHLLILHNYQRVLLLDDPIQVDNSDLENMDLYQPKLEYPVYNMRLHNIAEAQLLPLYLRESNQSLLVFSHHPSKMFQRHMLVVAKADQ